MYFFVKGFPQIRRDTKAMIFLKNVTLAVLVKEKFYFCSCVSRS